MNFVPVCLLSQTLRTFTLLNFSCFCLARALRLKRGLARLRALYRPTRGLIDMESEVERLKAEIERLKKILKKKNDFIAQLIGAAGMAPE